MAQIAAPVPESISLNNASCLPRGGHGRAIVIKHPGYTPAENLLSLPAYDGTSVPGIWGCSHRLVIDACRILANNRAGFVSTTPHRSGRVSTAVRTLTASVYYYFLDDDRDPQYPVNAQFDTWSFPDRLPAHWFPSHAAALAKSLGTYATSESDVSAQLQVEDATCVVTGNSDFWEDAYLIPPEQGYWFLGHKMWLHNADTVRRSVDDPANNICLQPDLHRLFDQHTFVFYPSEYSTSGWYITYFIQPERVYAEGLHRVEARIPEPVSPHFVYARFALSVLSSATVSRDVVTTVKHSAKYEAELTALMKAKLGRQPDSQRASIRNNQASHEREQLEAVRKQLAVEEAFYRRYPHLRQEVTHSDDPDYQTLAWHPEVDRMRKLAEVWFGCNPQIRQRSHSDDDRHTSSDSVDPSRLEWT